MWRLERFVRPLTYSQKESFECTGEFFRHGSVAPAVQTAGEKSSQIKLMLPALSPYGSAVFPDQDVSHAQDFVARLEKTKKLRERIGSRWHMLTFCIK